MGLQLYVAVILITIGQVWGQMPLKMGSQGTQQENYIPEECLKLFPGGGPQPAQAAQPQYPAPPPTNLPSSSSAPVLLEETSAPFSAENSRSEESPPPDKYQENPNYLEQAAVAPPADSSTVSPTPFSIDGVTLPPQPPMTPPTPPPGDGNMICMDSRYLSLIDRKFTEELKKLYKAPPLGLPPMAFYRARSVANYGIPFQTQMPSAGSIEGGTARRYVPISMPPWQMEYPQWGGPTFAYPQFYKNSPTENA